MTNAFYNASGAPSTNSAGTSSTIRSELAAVQAGFDRMPALTGNSLKLIRVNAAATGLECDPTAYLTAVAAAAAYLPLAGGTMTGAITSTFSEAHRIVHSTGYISFFDGTNTTRSGFIQGNAGGLGLALSSEGAGSLVFNTSSTLRMSIDPSGNVSINNPVLLAAGASVLTQSTAGGLAFVANPSLVDGVARIELYGTTAASNPRSMQSRADLFIWTKSAASTELMRLDPAGGLVVRAISQMGQNNTGSLNGSVGYWPLIVGDGTTGAAATNNNFVRVGRFASGNAGLDAFQGGVGGSTLSLGSYGSELATISAAGNFGIGLGSAVSPAKFAVASAGVNVASLTAWTNAHSTFGPNAGAATGAALGLGYDTTNDQATIISLAPNVQWKKLSLYSAGLDLYSTSGNLAARMDASGNFLLNSITATYASAGRGTLEVNGASSSIAALKVNNAGAGYIYHDGSTFRLTNAVAGGSLFFGNNIGDKMAMDPNGNFGIGILAPQARLHVTLDTGDGPVLMLRNRATNGALHKFGALVFSPYRDVADPVYGAAIWAEGTSAAGYTADMCFGTSVNAGAAAFPPVSLRINSVGTVMDGAGNELGYRIVPQTLYTGASTLALADRGRGHYKTDATSVTVPAGVFGLGDTVMIFNWNGSFNMSIIQGSGMTMYKAASGALTGNRTLLGVGVATVLFQSGSTCLISGSIT